MTPNYRRAYFSLLNTVCKESGDSKYNVHQYWKKRILPFLKEDPDNFIDNKINEDFTTANLNEKGWKTFFNEWQHFCLTFFNITS